MWKKIVMPCPVCIHDKADYSVQPWTHGDVCGGDLYMDEKGYVHCLKCGKSAFVKSMFFSCDSKCHMRKQASENDIAAAVSMLKSDDSLESLKWVKSVIEKL